MQNERIGSYIEDPLISLKFSARVEKKQLISSQMSIHKQHWRIEYEREIGRGEKLCDTKKGEVIFYTKKNKLKCCIFSTHFSGFNFIFIISLSGLCSFFINGVKSSISQFQLGGHAFQMSHKIETINRTDDTLPVFIVQLIRFFSNVSLLRKYAWNRNEL